MLPTPRHCVDPPCGVAQHFDQRVALRVRARKAHGSGALSSTLRRWPSCHEAAMGARDGERELAGGELWKALRLYILSNSSQQRFLDRGL